MPSAILYRYCISINCLQLLNYRRSQALFLLFISITAHCGFCEVQITMRIEDVDFAKTNKFEIKPADSDNCRRIVAVLARTKNDKQGKGPVSGRTFVLPCICMQDLSAPDKKKFAKKLSSDPFADCISSCPFNVVKKYLNACPVSTNNNSEPLAFMRALTARGNPRTLTTLKLGRNPIKESIQKVCLILNLKSTSSLLLYIFKR